MHLLCCVALLELLGGGSIMAQSPEDAKIKQLQSKIDSLTAEKKKQASEFEAWKARYIGTVAEGKFSGSVEVKDKAGDIEASLLATKAIKEASSKICAEVARETANSPRKKILLFRANTFPDFQRLMAFRFQKELLRTALMETEGEAKRPIEPFAIPAAVGASLEALNNILGFLRTDYTVGAVNITLEESLLLNAVAGGLVNQRISGKNDIIVQLPLIYDPLAGDDTIKSLTRELAELDSLRAKTETLVEQADREYEDAKGKADGEKDNAKKTRYQKEADAIKARCDRMKGLITLYDDFVKSFTTADAKTGKVPLVEIAQEFAIGQSLLKDANVLLLHLENFGGSYMIKKNIWSGLWGMPFYHTGGATVSYLLLDGQSGTVLLGGVVPIYGGFVKSNNIRKAVSAD